MAFFEIGFCVAEDPAASYCQQEAEQDGNGDDACGGQVQGVGRSSRGCGQGRGVMADFCQGRRLFGVGKGEAGGGRLSELFLQPKQADGKLDHVIVKLVIRQARAIGLGQAGLQ